MTTEPCYGVAGWFFGHSFVARYSLKERSAEWAARMNQEILTALLLSFPNAHRLTDKTYIGDVCQRCGARTSIPDTAQSSSPLPPGGG